MSLSGPDSVGSQSTGSGTLRATAREWFVTGAALTIPLLVTMMILGFLLNFVRKALAPVVGGLRFFGLIEPVSRLSRTMGLEAAYGPLLVEIGTIIALVTIIFIVGFTATRSSSDYGFIEGFHALIESIPGVGSVYMSFRRMSDVLIESGTESFRDVKLVEFPNDDVYSFAFVTATPPQSIGEAAGHKAMQTLFMPLAPNPVMGGFLIHVPDEQVFDVDVTVEEAVSAIVTSGVAINDSTSDGSLSPDEMAALGRYDGANPTQAFTSSQPSEYSERPDEDERHRRMREHSGEVSTISTTN